MKKTVLHAALFALSMPMSLYALGLGEMTVKSSLNQPFLAEIELIDVRSTPIPGIKVGIADPENFEQIGMDRAAVLSLLNFKIEKNEKGKFVIKVQSVERMTEPYMELVVDLTWPTGQLYKAYTVLLDPPGYQLTTTIAQSSTTHYKKVNHYSNEPGVIDKAIVSTVEHNPVTKNDGKKKTTYGPTITNENVWQIAQRYKTSAVILPQVVLAIVGANPEAFKDGNLNGLKVGVRLNIPSTEEIMQVPADLATEEAMAHDKAWNEKTAINHVLNPPYMTGQSNNTPPAQPVPQNNDVSSIPKLTMQSAVSDHIHQQLISTNAAVPVTTGTQPQIQNQKPQNSEQDARMKAELSITAAAVESVRESNALLMEQLRLLQEQNKTLQQQLIKRDKDLEAMRHQMEVLMKQRLAAASQASSATSEGSSSSYLPLILLLLLAAGGGGFAYWYFKLRQKESQDPYSIDSKEGQESSTALMKPVIPPVEDVSTKTQMISDFAPIKSSSEQEEPIPTADIRVSAKQDVEETVQEAALVKDETQAEVSEMTGKSAKKATKKKKETDVESTVIHIPEEPAVEESPKEETNIEEPVVPESEEQPIIDDSSLITEKSQDIDIPEFKAPVEDKPLEMKHETPQHPERPLSILSSVVTEEDEPSITKPGDEEPVEHDMLEFESGLLDLIQKKPAAETEKVEDSNEADDALDFVSPQDEPLKDEKADKEVPAEPEQFDGINFDDSSADEQLTEIEDSQPETPEDVNYDTDLDQSITDFFAESEQDNIIAKDTIDIDETAANSDLDTLNEPANPLKSTKALKTLLDLAKTYIGMDDFESARHSLDEVLEFGTEEQKEEARGLLDQIKDK
ncbi:FimV/HubP family polar landmark protein [Legionella shakespearei]|uniref:FimV protein n=1 Tax=Legionella shakespearei DSM 23087 TaxID=1122169 RepID=A0A0W0YQR3_9GAMM|nr:FimV/HubP family polar landmark protein [Legionella shakespearei]KTD59241.1 FimV protein [Legionella shakespearei DSM 23087]